MNIHLIGIGLLKKQSTVHEHNRRLMEERESFFMHNCPMSDSLEKYNKKVLIFIINLCLQYSRSCPMKGEGVET